MYLNHFSNIMSDAYDENYGLTDSDCNVGEERIYKPKSYVETKAFSLPVRSTRRAIVFIIPNKFNVQFMPNQDTDNSVHVSFLPVHVIG